MIISNLKYYKLIPKSYLINNVNLINKEIFKGQGYLIVKPSGKLEFRRKLPPEQIPDPAFSEEQIIQCLKFHMEGMKRNVEQFDSLKSSESESYKLISMFDLSNYHEPLISKNPSIRSIGGRYLIETKKYTNVDKLYTETRSKEIKDECWVALLNRKMDIKAQKQNGETITNINFDSEYLVLYFNKSHILKLVCTSSPILDENIIENIEISNDYNNSEFRINYLRSLDDMLIPVLYKGLRPIQYLIKDNLIKDTNIIDQFIEKFVPDNILPERSDPSHFESEYLNDSENLNSEDLEKRITVNELGVNSTNLFNNYAALIKYNIKLVTTGIGGIYRLQKLDNNRYKEIWRRGNIQLAIEGKDIVNMDYNVSHLLTGNAGSKLSVTFDMDLISEPQVSIYDALNWMAKNDNTRGIALLKLDETHMPEADLYYNTGMKIWLNSIDDTKSMVELKQNYTQLCKDLALVAYCIYIIRLYQKTYNIHNNIIITKDDYDNVSDLFSHPLFSSFIKKYNFILNVDNSLNDNYHSNQNTTLSTINVSKLIKKSEYQCKRMMEILNDIFVDLLYDIKINSESNILYDSKNRYSWNPIAATRSDYLEKRNYPKEYFNKYIRIYGVVHLNYCFSKYNPLDWLNNQVSSDIYYKASNDQSFEEILVHEVGHCLALVNEHSNPSYGYEVEGLSSNLPNQIYPTPENVINILNDTSNRLNSKSQ